MVLDAVTARDLFSSFTLGDHRRLYYPLGRSTAWQVIDNIMQTYIHISY